MKTVSKIVIATILLATAAAGLSACNNPEKMAATSQQACATIQNAERDSERFVKAVNECVGAAKFQSMKDGAGSEIVNECRVAAAMAYPSVEKHYYNYEQLAKDCQNNDTGTSFMVEPTESQNPK